MSAFGDWLQETFITPILAAIEEMKARRVEAFKATMIQMLTQAPNVTALDNIWSGLNTEAQNDALIRQAYEARKADLTQQGLLSPADGALGAIGSGVKKGVDAVTGAALSKLMPIFEEVMEEQKIPEADRQKIRRIASSGEFGLNAVVSFMLGHFLSPIITTSLSPVWRNLEQQVNERIRSSLIDPTTLIRCKYRGISVYAGYNEQLEKQGYHAEDIAALEEVTKFYPSGADFISFAVRDVFNPDVYRKYGYDEFFPEDIVTYAAKAGMPKDILTWYWRAHWVLPSPNQAFEMLHRQEISEDDIRLILKANDYAPYFVDKYIKIAYNPVTRVDLRRLYQEGTYSEEQVFNGYLALGNSPEDAKALTAWTVARYSPEEKDLTKTEILKNYRVGKAEKATVIAMLKELDYTEDQIQWFLAYEDYQLTEELTEAEAETLISELINGTKTLEDVQKALSALNLPEKAKNRYLKTADQTARKQVKQPSKADLTAWFKKDIITADVFRSRMSKLLYSSSDIEKYIEEAEKVE